MSEFSMEELDAVARGVSGKNTPAINKGKSFLREPTQEEINKIFKLPTTAKALKLLVNSGLAMYIFPNVNINVDKLQRIHKSKRN